MQKSNLKIVWIVGVALNAIGLGHMALEGIAVGGTTRGAAHKAVSGTAGEPDLKVARQVEQVLRHVITSPNNNLKISVTPNSRSREGYFSRVSISGKPVQVRKLPISEFSLYATDVRLSVDKLKLNKVSTVQAKTQFRAVVTENDLTTMLARSKGTKKMGLKAKYLKDPTNGDVLQVTGNWAWSWFSGPVTGVGKLRVTPDNKVYADILSLKLNGAEVPGFVKNKFAEKINPVIDYDDVPFDPQFRTLKVEGSRAILTS